MVGPLIRWITLINCKLGDYNDLKIHCRPPGFSNTYGWSSLKVRGWSPVMTNGDKRKQLMIWRWNGVVMCDTLCDKLCDTVKHMMWWGVTSHTAGLIGENQTHLPESRCEYFNMKGLGYNKDVLRYNKLILENCKSFCGLSHFTLFNASPLQLFWPCKHCIKNHFLDA